MPTVTTAIDMIPRTRPSGFKGTCGVPHPNSCEREDVHAQATKYDNGFPTVAISHKDSVRYLRPHFRSGGVHKYKRDYTGYGYGFRYGHRPQGVFMTCRGAEPTNDLGRYHYFCPTMTAHAGSSKNSGHTTRDEPPEAGSSAPGPPAPTPQLRSQDIVRPDMWSWSSAYSAFDYWCFYRIELLKYQLQQAAYQQQRRSRSQSA